MSRAGKAIAVVALLVESVIAGTPQTKVDRLPTCEFGNAAAANGIDYYYVYGAYRNIRMPRYLQLHDFRGLPSTEVEAGALFVTAPYCSECKNRREDVSVVIYHGVAKHQKPTWFIPDEYLVEDDVCSYGSAIIALYSVDEKASKEAASVFKRLGTIFDRNEMIVVGGDTVKDVMAFMLSEPEGQ